MEYDDGVAGAIDALSRSKDDSSPWNRTGFGFLALDKDVDGVVRNETVLHTGTGLKLSSTALQNQNKQEGEADSTASFTTNPQQGRCEEGFIDVFDETDDEIPSLVDSRQELYNENNGVNDSKPCALSQEANELQSNRPDFSMGDHVFQWCSLAGVPRMYQHHGIVLDVYWCTIEREWVLKIVDFSNRQLENNNVEYFHSEHRYASSSVKKKSVIRSNGGGAGCIRSYEVTFDDTANSCLWHKVEYNATWWKRSLHRAGSCTAADCDAPGLVRARAQFLIDHSDLLPPFSATYSNCECVAVWCKTGRWSTLQASSWLYATVASQAKQAATLAGVASAATVTVPSAGIWGWFGYTTTVSLTSTQPLLLPAIAAYGVITTAGPAVWLMLAKNHWSKVTKRLNAAFWEAAVDNPEVFVDCITHWSEL